MTDSSIHSTPPKVPPISGLFSATQRPGIPSQTLRRELRETMSYKLLGLPYDEWIDAFLPVDDSEVDYDGIFDGIVIGVEALNGTDILGDFALAESCARYDKTDKSKKKLDGGMYPKGTPAIEQKRTDWATVEVFIECKTNDSCDPYVRSWPTQAPSSSINISPIT
ncbi:hypothetical protein NUW54_g11607 [Trametes sanguinea]|uniref:Uncharacterized protein n=1 Tax=Trametes sanguinea TaxID=158606 RepID=A0ACC1NBG1_9APHY|nr:hypothetical protein NUW54_g11607 [Trametes sanguinea]